MLSHPLGFDNLPAYCANILHVLMIEPPPAHETDQDAGWYMSAHLRTIYNLLHALKITL
jgi:hypothetical protein